MRRPLIVASVALAAYAIFVGAALVRHSPEYFAVVAHHIRDPSPEIAAHVQPGRQKGADGYDGQFAYFIAVDPGHAASSMDWPAYRYSHITYPILARVAAAGQPGAIPIALIAVNLAALFVATFSLAVLLVRRRKSAWLALLFAFYPGVFVVVDRDLNELVGFACALSAAALLERRNGRLPATVLFAIGGLARETTLLIPVALAVAELRRRPRDWRPQLALVAGAVIPYAVWRIVLAVWLGTQGSAPPLFAHYPFGGIVSGFDLGVIAVLVPALLVVAAGWGRFAPNGWTLLLGLQLLLFLVMAPAIVIGSYWGGTRIMIATLVAALLSLERPRRRLAIAAAAVAVGLPVLLGLVALAAS